MAREGVRLSVIMENRYVRDLLRSYPDFFTFTYFVDHLMVSPFFEVINFGRGRRSIDEVLRPKSVLFDFDADCLDSKEMVKIHEGGRISMSLSLFDLNRLFGNYKL